MNKQNLLSILSFSFIVLFGASCTTVSNKDDGVDKANSSETEPSNNYYVASVRIKISNALRETIQYGDSATGPWKDLAPSSSYTKKGDRENPGLNITFIDFKTSRGSGDIWGMNGNLGYPSVTVEIPGQGHWNAGYFSEGETKSQKADNWTYTVIRHNDDPGPWYALGTVKNFELIIADTTPYHKLTVSDADQLKNGTVTSTPSGIDCGSTCEASFASATTVALTATPRPGYFLSGSSWTGCDSTGADGTTCTVAINDKDRNVSVKFERSNDNTLTVSKQGCGKVTSVGGEIDCGMDRSACRAKFLPNELVTLTAETSSDCVLTKWSGCDSTTGRLCEVRLNSDRDVGAKFHNLDR